MDSNITDHEKQLMLLRALTATTGAVHEGQLLQLRMWAALAFDFTTWQAEVDVANKTVIYTVGKIVNKKSEKLVKCVASLDNSIHWLFGDNWGLRINEGKKQFYVGSRKTKNVNDERRARASNRES
jgi:hypothetical protein